MQAFCLCRGDAVPCQPLLCFLQTWAWVTHCSCRIGVLAAAQKHLMIWLQHFVLVHTSRRNLGLPPLQERGGNDGG